MYILIGEQIEMLKTLHYTAHNSEEAAMQAFTAGLDVEASSNCYPLLADLIKEGKLMKRF